MIPRTRWPLLLILALAAVPHAGGADAAPGAAKKVRDKAELAQARDRALRELAADPKNVAQWKRLAMIQRHLGDEKGTEEALNKAAALDPKDAGVAFMRGLLHEKRGQGAKAAAAFRACLDTAAQPKLKGLCAKHLRRTEAP